MHKRIVSSQDQIQRLNLIINKVKSFQKLEFDKLKKRPAPDKWSIIEVIGHMNAAYKLYESRIDEMLTKLPDRDQAIDEFKVGRKNALFIKMISPKGQKRPMKMKTMKRFYPVFQVENLEYENMDSIFHTFYEYQNHLKEALLNSRKKENKKARIVSAVGPMVKFYLPEAYEFIIGHMERHIVQIEEQL